MTVLIDVEGVLRTDTGDPVQSVELIVRSMLEDLRVVFCSEEESAENYLARQKLDKFVQVRKQSTLEALADERTLGHVDVVITADTEVAKSIARQGVSVFLCASSTVVDPRYKPERKAWGDIVKEAEL